MSDKENIKPFNQYVLVKIVPSVDEENKTESGIIVPDSVVKERNERRVPVFEVLAVGDDLVTDVEVGDWVYIQGSGSLVYASEEKEENRFIVNSKDIIAKDTTSRSSIIQLNG